MSIPNKALVVALVVLLAGCSGSTHQDLEDYMAAVKGKPTGEIEPIPTFSPYKAYKYTAVALRSPFDRPLQAVAADGNYGRTAVAPDESRAREYLEGHNFASLSMVGTLAKDGVVWALVNDGAGGIHRVTSGNYMGKNHGKVTAVTRSLIEVVEIVPDGKNGWVERPRTLALKER